VASTEYEKHKAEIVSREIAITHTLKWKGTLESFYFEDPIGNVVEIVPEGIWD
jgi:hypothetical protein